MQWNWIIQTRKDDGKASSGSGASESSVYCTTSYNQTEAALQRVEGFLKEFDAVGLKDNVIIKAANESIDMSIPNIDSEYKIGYDLTKEL